MAQLWDTVKSSVRKDLKPEEAQLLESVTVDDLMDTDGLLRKLADDQLGPLLRSMGCEEEPKDFFIDMLKLALFFQFICTGLLFYSTELWGHFDTGEAFRAAFGLGLGFFSRPLIPVEHFMAPVYHAVVGLISPNAVYEIPEPTASERQATLNKLGILAGLIFLLPQLLWGWDAGTCLQLALPMPVGWLLFDVTFLLALLLKLRAY